MDDLDFPIFQFLISMRCESDIDHIAISILDL